MIVAAPFPCDEALPITWSQWLARRNARSGGRPVASGYGAPTLLRPRLGQRSFGIAVLDAWGRRCSVTSERTLPALEAAHIRDRPYCAVAHGRPGAHPLERVLFCADIHKLFDAGYVTVTPELRFEVSRRIKEEYENGRDYYRLHGSPIRLPTNPVHRPDAAALGWHNEERFLG